jgi:hypothetical protein
MSNHKKSSKKQKHTRKQKIYRMKGCSSSCKIKSHNHKKYLGGDSPQLAYPSSDVPKTSNPFLAYTGSSNIDASDKIYPSSGPSPSGFNFLNPQNFLHGGKNKKGGNCGCNLMQGGGNCGCNLQQSGGSCSAGNSGIPYPNGLLGKPWTPNPSGWPGVNDIAMDRNHLGYNTYSPVDISRQMVNEFPNPFKLIGGRKNKNKKSKKTNTKNKKTTKKRGGAMSNMLGQDFINLGRQMTYGLGSAYNAISGYPSPVNPMPWKGQLQNNLTSSNNINNLNNLNNVV